VKREIARRVNVSQGDGQVVGDPVRLVRENGLAAGEVAVWNYDDWCINLLGELNALSP
jgi:hypothetical protein